MMSAERITGLIDTLPVVRGTLEGGVSLARYTWFKVGGPAEVIFRPADVEDLSTFLNALSDDIPVTVFGTASNLLVRDGGLPGVVIRLGRPFSNIKIKGTHVTAGAGAVDLNVARQARDAGIEGLEFLCGVPGTVGGALRMNAGAYGSEVKDIFEYATAVDREGNVHRLEASDMGFSYRHTTVPEDWTFVEGGFLGQHGNTEQIAQRMVEIQQQREASQPIRTPTGGSTFKNPEGHKAWELVDQAGCRGLTVGGAMVSPQHCNFLINTGNATAADLENLGEEVRQRVLKHSGIKLQWEIRRIGNPLPSHNSGGPVQ